MNYNGNSSDYQSSNNGYDYEVYSNIELPQNLNFSLDEIRHQLNLFGYTQIPDDKLFTIKKDLDEIIANDGSLKDLVVPKKHENNDWFVSGTDTEVENDDSSYATVTSLSPASSKMKRKTVRKKNTNNIDEFTSEPTTSRTGNWSSRRGINNVGHDDDNNCRKVSFPQDPVDDIFNYTRVSVDPSEFTGSRQIDKRPSSKTSLIKTNFTKMDNGWQKHDPVSRYHSYKVAWNQKKAPGESPHKELRWAVKAALMVKEVPRPRTVRTNSARATNFLPPGQNKRSDLRWQIRQDLANPDVYFD